jgi:hypothetical protein
MEVSVQAQTKKDVETTYDIFRHSLSNDSSESSDNIILSNTEIRIERSRRQHFPRRQRFCRPQLVTVQCWPARGVWQPRHTALGSSVLTLVTRFHIPMKWSTIEYVRVSKIDDCGHVLSNLDRVGIGVSND